MPHTQNSKNMLFDRPVYTSLTLTLGKCYVVIIQ